MIGELVSWKLQIWKVYYMGIVDLNLFLLEYYQIMKIYLIILTITLAASQRYFFPGEVGVYGPAKDSSSTYMDCFVSRSTQTSS